MSSWETFARERAARAVLFGASFVLLALLVTACGSSNESAGLSQASGGQAMSSGNEIAQLNELERPVVRELKLAFIDLSKGRDAGAAERLERAADGGGRLLDWLETHREFAEANGGSVECVDESVHELREQVERIGERLRDDRASQADNRELRIRLGEVVNCINTSD
jgi:hypothetical protein